MTIYRVAFGHRYESPYIVKLYKDFSHASKIFLAYIDWSNYVNQKRLSECTQDNLDDFEITYLREEGRDIEAYLELSRIHCRGRIFNEVEVRGNNTYVFSEDSSLYGFVKPVRVR